MSDYEETNPLTPIHAIGRLTYDLDSYAHALKLLGIPAGDDLAELSKDIKALAKESADRVCRETSRRLSDQQESTNKMLGAALSACLIKDLSSHDQTH